MSDEKKALSLAVDAGDNTAAGLKAAADKVDATIGQGLEASAKAAENIAREARGAASDVAQGISGGLGAAASAAQGVAKEASATIGHGFDSLSGAVRDVAKQASDGVAQLAATVTRPAVLATGAFSWLAYVYVGVVLAAVLIWPVKDIVLQGMATWERQQTEIRKERASELEAAAQRDARIKAESEAAKAKADADKAAKEAEKAKLLKESGIQDLLEQNVQLVRRLSIGSDKQSELIALLKPYTKLGEADIKAALAANTSVDALAGIALDMTKLAKQKEDELTALQRDFKPKLDRALANCQRVMDDGKAAETALQWKRDLEQCRAARIADVDRHAKLGAEECRKLTGNVYGSATGYTPPATPSTWPPATTARNWQCIRSSKPSGINSQVGDICWTDGKQIGNCAYGQTVTVGAYRPCW